MARQSPSDASYRDALPRLYQSPQLSAKLANTRRILRQSVVRTDSSNDGALAVQLPRTTTDKRANCGENDQNVKTSFSGLIGKLSMLESAPDKLCVLLQQIKLEV